MALVQHVPEWRWQWELAKATDRRIPSVPVPVAMWLSLDSRAWDGELHGWAIDPNGAGGLMGLVVLVREFTQGFEAEHLHWQPSVHISRR